MLPAALLSREFLRAGKSQAKMGQRWGVRHVHSCGKVQGKRGLECAQTAWGLGKEAWWAVQGDGPGPQLLKDICLYFE